MTQTGRTELEVAAMTSELKILIKNIIRRIKELDQYKESDSVKVREIEHLQEIGEKLRKSYQDPWRELGKIQRLYKDCESGEPSSKNEKRETKRLMKYRKIELETLDASLDVGEDRFRKYNVPKRVETMSEQPLKPYLDRLGVMKIAWRKGAEENRVKKQRSLIEWMEKLDQSNEEENCFSCKMFTRPL